MGEITVNGASFNIQKEPRDKYNPSFILKIYISNFYELDMQRHELTRVLSCGSRRQLTDDLIKDELAAFLDTYPDAEIKRFGVAEEFTARVAERIDPPQHS